jgi:four helix bundle protein
MQKPSHEKLDVYQRSIAFLSVAVQLLESVPKGNAMIIDQLKRASTSAPLNIGATKHRYH